MKKSIGSLIALLLIVLQFTAVANETESSPIVYHSNAVINQLLIDYNAIAEYPILPEQVEPGVRRNNADAPCNGVWLRMWEANNGEPSIDFRVDSAKNDKHIFPIFRDFAKVMNSEFSDKQLEKIWKELQSGKYEGYDYYRYENIKASYWKKKYDNGKYQYSISLWEENE